MSAFNELLGIPDFVPIEAPEPTPAETEQEKKFVDGVNAKFPCTGLHGMIRERGPVPYLCDELKIGPGSVTIIGGSGFGGKTLVCMDMAVSVMTGTPFLGRFAVQRGRVAHFDYEMGDRLTGTRYIRMLRDRGIDGSTLPDDSLGCYLLPRAISPESIDEMTYLAQGATLCIVDAFRGAFVSVSENDSSSRACLDMLTRVSERTGCTMLVIMHSKKESKDIDVRGSLRGSSSLFDAAQCVYMLTADKNKPTKVHHEKERQEGILLPTFGFTVSDIERNGDPRWGLRLEYLSDSDVAAAYYVGADNDSRRIDPGLIELSTLSLADRILTLAMKRDSITRDEAIQMTRRSSLDVRVVIEELVKAGGLVQEGKSYVAARRPT